MTRNIHRPNVQIIERKCRSVYMEGGLPTYDEDEGRFPCAVDVTITFRTTGGAESEMLRLLADPLYLHLGGGYEFKWDPTDRSLRIYFKEPKPSEGGVRFLTDAEWRERKKELAKEGWWTECLK